MLYGIISDIHSNLEALESALAELDDAAVDEIICLGDIVGYGANPNECVEIIRERGIRSIAGNHDAVASGMEEPDYFNHIARLSILWTRTVLTKEHKEFLRALPRSIDNGGFLVVHGALTHADNYITGIEIAKDEYEHMEGAEVCFFGHTHLGVCFEKDADGIRMLGGERIVLKEGAQYLINPGSVGQPRDRDPRAAFIVYDDSAREVRCRRVEYDIPAAQKKIKDSGLSDALAMRLAIGV